MAPRRVYDRLASATGFSIGQIMDKEAWIKFSPLLDEAMDLDELQRGSRLDQLDVENPEAAAFIRSYFETREKAARLAFLEGSLAAEEAAASWIGRQVGPYTISALMGQGG